MADINSYVNQAASGGGLGQKSAREVEVLLSANTGQFQEEMKKAGTAAGGVADALHKVEQAYVSTLRRIGQASIGFGASMTATATGAAWSAAGFEEQFARVAKTTGLDNSMGQFLGTLGIGGNELQQFANDIRMLSTEMPVAAQELAYLADVAGTLGVEAQHLAHFAGVAATLGAAINELSSAQAIAGLANLMGAFGDAPETVDNLASSLSELANRTRGTADDMLFFSNRLAGTAVQVGMTSEEVLALGAAVSAIGAQPELGASALIQFFTKMSQAVQSGNQDLERFASVMGMTKSELQDLYSMEGATATFFRFIQALSQQGEEASMSLQSVGLQGIATTQVLGGLAAQVDVLADSLNISNEAYEDGTAAAELAAIRFDTVVKSLQQFRQAIAEVFRSMGQGFLPIMKKVIDAMTWVVNLFNRLPQPVKTVIGLFTGFTGALLTLAGAAVLLFAKFHIFFMLLHTARVLLPALSAGFLSIAAALQKLRAGQAAAHAFTLARAFEAMGRVLGNIPEAARQMALSIGEHSLRASALMRQAWAKAGAITQDLLVRLSSIGTMTQAAAARAIAAIRGLGAQFMALMGVARTAVGTMVASLGAIPAMARTAAASMVAHLRAALVVITASARASFGFLVAQLGTLPAQARLAGAALLTHIQGALVALGAVTRAAMGVVLAQLARIPIAARAMAAHLATQLAAGLQMAVAASRAAMATIMAQLAALPAAARLAGTALVARLSTAFTTIAVVGRVALQQVVALLATIPGAVAAIGTTMLRHVQTAFAGMVATSRAAIGAMVGHLGLLATAARGAMASLIASLQTALLASLQAAGAAVGTFAASLLTLGRVAKATTLTLLRYLRAGFTAVGNAALIASKKILGFVAKETLRGMQSMFWFLGKLTKGFIGLAGAITKAAGAKLLLMAPFLKFVAIAAAIGAAIGGIVWLWRRFRGETEDVVGQMEALVLATHGSYQALDRLGSSLEEVSVKSLDFARESSAMVAHLQALKEAGDDAAAQNYLLRYGMLLLSQGVEPEVVQRQVEELARLADTPIIFEYAFREMVTGSGFDNVLEAASQGLGDLIERMEGDIGTSWWRPFKTLSNDFEANLDNYIDVVKAVADENAAARLAALRELETSLQAALEAGTIDRSEYDAIIDRLRDEGIIQDDAPGWFERWFYEWDPDAPLVNEWAEDIARILEDTALKGNEEFGLIADAVREITGETYNLGEAVRNLTDEEAEELHERLKNIAFDVAQTELPTMEDSINALHAAWLGVGQSIPTQNMDRYRRHLAETWGDTVGHAQALADAEQWLASLNNEADLYGEEWEYVNRLVKEFGDQVNQTYIKDLDRELNARSAAEQVRFLTLELQKLDMSIPRERDLGEEIFGRREQAVERVMTDFRQVMSQYDSLREQEARTVEDHNRRMERMEEDHQRRLTRMREQRDRSIEDAGKRLQERLEAIAKQEQDLLERRIETVSNAFRLMERIQSAPSASIGALAHNMELQNRVMSEMEDNIRQLRRMGLDDEVMEALGFDDPRNFAQAQRMLEEALSDPGMIDEINRQWKRRLEVGESFTKEIEEANIGDTIAEQMAEARDEARKAHDEQVADIRRRFTEQLADANETYARQVKDAEENHTRQMNGIAENIAKLGDRSVEAIADLIKRGVETGIEGVMEMARELDAVMYWMNGSIDRGLSAVEETIQRRTEGFTDKFGGLIESFEHIATGGLTPRPVSTPQNQWTRVAYAEGGPVPGQGNEDNVPALLTPGEFVMNPKAVERYGVEFMEAINAQHFAVGGPVGMPTRRGREYGGSSDLVGAFTKALKNANLGSKSETNFGPITVQAQDVNQMLRELEQRKRVARLTNNHVGGEG